MDINKEMRNICKTSFEKARYVVSWKEFIEDLQKGENPFLFTRTSFQYMSDAIDAAGKSLTIDSGEPIVTYNAFSDPFTDGEHAIYGLERILGNIVSDISTFANEEAPDRSLGIVGPPGSCKTPIFELIGRSMEEYSKTDLGRVLSFGFSFLRRELPRPGHQRGTVRFNEPGIMVHDYQDKKARQLLKGPDKDRVIYLKLSADGMEENMEKIVSVNEDTLAIVVEGSYAYLPRPLIGKDIICPTLENPLHMIPLTAKDTEGKYSAKRTEYLEFLFDMMNEKLTPDEKKSIPLKIKEQSLCQACDKIWKRLRDDCRGDYNFMFDHVFVEAFEVSETSGVGIASIGPDDSLKANVMPLRDEHIARYLPNLDIVQYTGKLANAQRGMLHMHDFLKVEPGKQLSKTSPTLRLIQNNKFEVGPHTIETDISVVWTSNDAELIYAEDNDLLTAFFDRSEIRDVNYILNVNKEKLIYLHALKNTAKRLHIAPHTADVAAMRAVLTRLEKPIFPETAFPELRDSNNPDNQSRREAIKDIYENLTPFQKMKIYASRNKADVDQILFLPKDNEVRRIYEGLPDKTKKYLKGETNLDPQSAHLRNLGVFSDIIFDSRLTREVRIDHISELEDIREFLTPEFMRTLRKENAYEGKNGISPRKMQDILREVTKNLERDCLNPQHIFDFIKNDVVQNSKKYNLVWTSYRHSGDSMFRRFIKRGRKAEKSDDPYNPEGSDNYFKLDAFIDEVRDKYNGVVKKEIVEAMSEINEDAIDDYLRRYFDNVRAYNSKDDKVKDRETGKWVAVNETLMRKVEDKLGKKTDEERQHHRLAIAQEIGDLKQSGRLIYVDNDPMMIDYRSHFDWIYEHHRADERTLEMSLEQLKDGFIFFGTEGYKDIDDIVKHKVEWTINRLKVNGYCNHCARDLAIYAIENNLIDELAPQKSCGNSIPARRFNFFEGD